MEADGVDVRPLYQITGEAEFNEVYFDDVHIPDDLRIGEVGQGWAVAMTTLMNERVAIGVQGPPRRAATAPSPRARRLGASTAATTRRARRARALWIEAEAMRLTTDPRRREPQGRAPPDRRARPPSCTGPTSTRPSPRSPSTCSAPRG
jgi:alkylation response protein AidB-like acyl-CoA dehydrogenase